MRLWWLAALALLIIPGCITTVGPLPNWSEDEVPVWVPGELWHYTVDNTTSLHITVVGPARSESGIKSITTDWVWQGMRPNVTVTWRIWHDLETLGWLQVSRLDAEGNPMEISNQVDCPLATIFPMESRTERCLYQRGAVRQESNLYIQNLGPSSVMTPFGELATHGFAYSSDFGEPFNGSYAPAVGHWGTMEMNVPQDRFRSDLRLHVLDAYYNPRVDRWA